jgi:hypothetical protein
MLFEQVSSMTLSAPSLNALSNILNATCFFASDDDSNILTRVDHKLRLDKSYAMLTLKLSAHGYCETRLPM